MVNGRYIGLFYNEGSENLRKRFWIFLFWDWVVISVFLKYRVVIKFLYIRLFCKFCC